MSRYAATFALCVAELGAKVSLREDLAVRQWHRVAQDTPWGIQLPYASEPDDSTFARAYGTVLRAGTADVFAVLEAP